MIAIGSDHGGYKLKEEINENFENMKKEHMQHLRK